MSRSVPVFALALAAVYLAACLSVEARPSREIEVLTYPPGAKVTDQYQNFLGKSGGRVTIEPDNYLSENVQLQILLDGYEPHSIDVPSYVKRVPKTGTMVLVPNHVGIRVRDFVRYQPWFFPTLLLVGGGLFHLSRRRREREDRLTKLEAYQGETEIDSLVFQHLGGYRLVKIIGRGGMATVYRALPEESLDESEAIAIKVLSRQLVDARDHVERFRREANVCRSLSHPGLVRVLDWGERDRYFWLAMELMEGETLRQKLSHGRLASSEALELLAPIFEGIGYAHQQGVIHRDLKPDNIMLTAKGRPKVMDFGLAKGLESARVTATGIVLGTPAYMAPEQIRGMDLDGRADQYSLGIIAFEMLTGEHPFTGDEMMDLMLSQMNDAPPLPSAVNSELGSEVDEVIHRMLAKDPERRFPTVEEAWEGLQQAMGARR